MSAQAVRLSNLDIDNAIKNNEFELLFQPIFDLGNGALARIETFVRWRHPALGLLPPGAFISFFESQGRMSELTRHILDAALASYTDWRGPYAPGFSLNLALTDLADESFPTHFQVLLRQYEFPADLITLECPMPPVDHDPALIADAFARLAGTGARLAIEVRGRTNDFLHRIDPFPFQEIKTGGAAILRFARTVRGPGLSAISELLELAAEKSAAIVAVGVEDQASLSAMRKLGFSAAQGNHLGKVGEIADFRPGRINDVRELLGLDPLSRDDLGAMFRTGGGAATAETEAEAPDDTPAASAPHNDAEVDAAAEEESPRSSVRRRARGESYESLIDRLSTRIETEGADPARTANLAKLKALKRKRDAARRAAIPADELEALAAPISGAGDQLSARDLQARIDTAFGEAGGPTLDLGAQEMATPDAAPLTAAPEAGANAENRAEPGSCMSPDQPDDMPEHPGPDVDANVVDASVVDASVVDAGNLDAGSVDAGSVDASVVDAGADGPEEIPPDGDRHTAPDADANAEAASASPQGDGHAGLEADPFTVDLVSDDYAPSPTPTPEFDDAAAMPADGPETGPVGQKDHQPEAVEATLPAAEASAAPALTSSLHDAPVCNEDDEIAEPAPLATATLDDALDAEAAAEIGYFEPILVDAGLSLTPLSVRMSIPQARAQFIPVYVVGPRYAAEAPSQRPAHQPSATVPPQHESPEESGFEVVFAAAAPALAREQEASDPGDDLDIDAAALDAAAVSSVPRRKSHRRNFLTRRYRWPIEVWRSVTRPTHFWPRSWRRAWARRAQERQAD